MSALSAFKLIEPSVHLLCVAQCAEQTFNVSPQGFCLFSGLEKATFAKSGSLAQHAAVRKENNRILSVAKKKLLQALRLSFRVCLTLLTDAGKLCTSKSKNEEKFSHAWRFELHGAVEKLELPEIKSGERGENLSNFIRFKNKYFAECQWHRQLNSAMVTVWK